MKKLISLIGVAALLSACGAATIQSGRVGAGPITASQANAFVAAIENANSVGNLTASELPLSGSTSYRGGVLLEVVNRSGTFNTSTGFAGRLEMEVFFAGAGSVTGRAGDFVYASAVSPDGLSQQNLTPVGGTLDLIDGQLQRSFPQTVSIAGDLAGILDLPSIATGTGRAESARFVSRGLAGQMRANGQISGLTAGVLTGTRPDSELALGVNGSFIVSEN